MKNRVKKIQGVVYTPSFLVKTILDLSDYRGANIRAKHIMENSCGEGVFLCEVVDRYCEVCSSQRISKQELKRELETFIHGLDIDSEAVAHCVANLNRVAERYDLVDVNWDVKLEDSTAVSRFDGQMDFVVGNPPYVRRHNLSKPSTLKQSFEFFHEGMSDLYIAFFEVGLRMLNDRGSLGYITPSSFFSSVAGARMRECFVEKRYLKKIVDMKHYQAFEGAITYTAITILQKGRSRNATYYYEYNGVKQEPCYICKLQPNDFYLIGKFFFANRSQLSFLHDILSCSVESDVYVKNGLATLCNTVFVSSSFPFQSKRIIPVIKASKGILQQMIFPYDENSRALSEDELKSDEELYDYLVKRREQLQERSLDKSIKDAWFLFGRRQGISDVYKDKLSLNPIVRDVSDLKMMTASPGTGVYSGLYITSPSLSLSSIRSQLNSDEFVSYVALLGKYKCGGYYTFSSKDVKKFLDYKFGCKSDRPDNSSEI